MKVYHTGCVALEITAWSSIMLASPLPQETAALQLCRWHPLRGQVLSTNSVPVSLLLESTLWVNHFYILYRGCFDILGFANS